MAVLRRRAARAAQESRRLMHEVADQGSAGTAPSGLWRRALLITAAAGLARLLLGATTPLFPDETYYWEWSRHLAAGYFDHPPMVAWLVKFGTLLLGHTPLGVRFGPIVAGVIAGICIAAAAGRLAGSRAAVIAALVFACMPLSAAGLILATPDAPLFAAGALLIYSVLRALEHPPGSTPATRWWCTAGVALGVAVASKYTAVLLPAGLLVALLTAPSLRGHLRSAGPYVATLISLVVFAPVIAWNARHDWASFAFQLQHGLTAARGSVLRRELDLLGGQAGLVTPILFVLMVIAAWRARAPRERLLAVMGAVVFAFFAYSATRRRVEANWPALAYVPGTLLLAAQVGGVRWSRWLRAGVVLAAVVTTVVYVNTVTPILPIPARRDPVARSAGWGDLAHAVDLERKRTGALVAAERYQDASELAFHLDGQPETFALNLTTRPNQYDWWPRLSSRLRRDDAVILVVDELPGAHPAVELLAPHFSAVRQRELVTLARDGDPVKYLRIWVMERWRGSWPTGELRSRP
jgi:hypothetical protein